jgi:hypothetical protein
MAFPYQGKSLKSIAGQKIIAGPALGVAERLLALVIVQGSPPSGYLALRTLTHTPQARERERMVRGTSCSEPYCDPTPNPNDFLQGRPGRLVHSA